MSTPHQILARQVKLAKHLQYLASFRHLGPQVIPGPPLPVTDEQVEAWRQAHPFVRSALSPAVARSLCYLETFKAPRPA
jgi:hypothetical protein